MVKLKPNEKEEFNTLLKKLKLSRRQFILKVIKGLINNENNI